ncbi:MAG: hypothetical protein GX130_01005 [Candidatus Hydrogenedens sp.]|jgi:hypothetical protein|nr:hypothetical protein [Candidatus Hydrogenedens sp.]
MKDSRYFMIQGAVILLFVALSTAVAVQAAELNESPEVTLLREAGGGKLYEVGGQKMLVMEGCAEEMGYQQGLLLSKEIRHIMLEGYMNNSLWNKGYSKEYVQAQSDRMEKFFPDSIREELQGMVKGLKEAGVDELSYEDLRLGITQAEILHFPPDGAPACSNFACWGKWTSDGRLLHGRNLDWSIKGGAQDDHIIMVWRPSGGIPFMMVGWAGGVGSVTGMNSQGITLGEMTLPSPDVTFDGMPLFLQMRLCLEQCGTLEEAVQFFQKCPRTTGWNFIIGDSKIPDGRALETDAKYCTAFAPMDPKETDATAHRGMVDAVRRTNHPAGLEQLLRLAAAFGREYGIEISSQEEIEAAKPLLMANDSWQRYDWISREIERQPGKMDVKEAVEILGSGPVQASNTLHSCVFDPQNKAIWVANAANNPPVPAWKFPYVLFDLSPWFD